MSRIAVLHPQCSVKGGAIQMALQACHTLQQQGHEVTLYTFEKSDECFAELQAGIDIQLWRDENKTSTKTSFLKEERNIEENKEDFTNNKSSVTPSSCYSKGDSLTSPLQKGAKKSFRKLSNIITLAFHLRHFDIIIANNPPMQGVAALAKVFSRNKAQTIWWHHHVPWYISPGNKIKSFFERHCIIPRIDQMVATSHFVGEKIREYCGRESVVIHPVIQIQSQSPFQGGADEGSGGMQQHQKSGYGEYTYPANTKLKSFSHQMSREMTRAEQRLWFEVLQSGKTGHKWVKQKIIGNFIVDFYCHDKRLVIEVDGGVHQKQEDYDVDRTKYLEKLGIRVIRYTNDLVLNQVDQVREKILREMEQIQDPKHQLDLSSPIYQTPSINLTGVSPGKGNGALDRDTEAGTVTLFTHGRLEAGKGINVLVKTFQKIKEMAKTSFLKEERNIEENKEDFTNNKSSVTPSSCYSKGDSLTSPLQKGAPELNLIIFGTGSLETKLREEGIVVQPFQGNDTFQTLSSGQFGHVIGVYCSSIDAFGMASLESQMAGFPTVILDRGGAREAILSDDDDYPVGYLVQSEEELLGTISRYVQNKILEKQMSNVNFSHKRDYFSPERLSRDLLSIITKIGY